jgi:hypothetical protein
MHMAVYPRAQYGYVEWAKGQDFIERYGPQPRILLFAMDHKAEVCFMPMGHSTEFH